MKGLRTKEAIALSAAFAALVAAGLWLRQPQSINTNSSETTLAPSLDISDRETRLGFLQYAQSADSIWPNSLINKCGARSVETYRVAVFTAFRNPEEQFVEVHTSDNAAISLSYFAPSPPPLPSSQIASTIAPPSIQALSLEKFREIATKAQQLLADKVPLTRGAQGADGMKVVFEFCKNGRYGFYNRYNPASNNDLDMHIVEIANLILTSANESLITAGFDASLTK